VAGKEFGFLAGGTEFADGHADVGELHAGRLGGGERECRGRRESDEHGVDPVRVREADPGAGINSLLWPPTAIATRGNIDSLLFAVFQERAAALFFSVCERIVAECLVSWGFLAVSGWLRDRPGGQDKRSFATQIG